MNKRTRFTNLLVFFLLITTPTVFAALAANLLWRLIFVDLQGLYVAPDWIYLTTCSIIPVIAFIQGLLFYSLYLRLLKFGQPIKSAGIDFLLGFLPFWFVIFSWTMFWGTACKLNHLPAHNAEALFSKIMHAYAGGLPLLVNAFIASACIGIFVAFLLHAFRSVFGAIKLSLPGRAKLDSAIPQ